MNDLNRFKPLADAASAVTIGDFEISNDKNALDIRGSLRLQPTKEDIQRAISLAGLFERAARALEKALKEGKSAVSKPTTGVDEFGLPQ